MGIVGVWKAIDLNGNDKSMVWVCAEKRVVNDNTYFEKRKMYKSLTECLEVNKVVTAGN